MRYISIIMLSSWIPISTANKKKQRGKVKERGTEKQLAIYKPG